jgi:3-hydroxy-9,10-secoandrosta-1,3,5(10)-triene-9,17-dione monooxygenase reductase component
MTFDSEEYRKVLGHLPTGVVIITLAGEGRPVGVTVGSFTSVSLSPPLVGFALKRTSGTLRLLRDAGAFAANVLGHDQSDVGTVFSTRGVDRFSHVTWAPGSGGAPLLDGAVAQLECTLESVVGAGDHAFVLGSVRDLRVVSGAAPLVFVRGRFGTLAH